MGLGFVIFFWLIIGTFLCFLGSVFLGAVTAFFTRRVPKGRRRIIIFAILFPFMCFAWSVAVFVFQGVVNVTLLGRDTGAGDSWYTKLPNGYEVMMIDVTDQGIFYNPKTQPVSDGATDQDDTAFGVRTAQVSGSYILGGQDSKEFEHFEKNNAQIDQYFILDAKTGKKTIFPNYDSLQKAANGLGVKPKLEPIYNVYSDNSFSYFDIFIEILFFIPPLVGFAFLIWYVIRLRRTRILKKN